MTNTSSSIDFVLLNQIINRYIPIPFLLFGIIGNTLNILIFSRRIFRQNMCVTYFLASAISDYFAMIFGLLVRVLNGFGYDISQNSSILCKLRYFIIYITGCTAACFIGLACFERYLSSSANIHRRQLITMKRVYLSIIIVIVLGCILFSEHFYCVDINQQLFGAPQSCYQLQQSIQCQIADSVLQILFQILIPAMMMIVFGLLTLGNIRQQHRRIRAIQTTNVVKNSVAVVVTKTTSILPTKSSYLPSTINRAVQKRDVQLITMSLIQMTIFVISTFPLGVYKTYAIITITESKSILRRSIENTIFSITVNSYFLNNTIKFYIYTLSGTVFRKELMKLFRFSRKYK